MSSTRPYQADQVEEVQRLKAKKELTWEQVYSIYKKNGGKNEYTSPRAFGKRVKGGQIADLGTLVSALRNTSALELVKPKEPIEEKEQVKNYLKIREVILLKDKHRVTWADAYEIYKNNGGIVECKPNYFNAIAKRGKVDDLDKLIEPMRAGNFAKKVKKKAIKREKKRLKAVSNRRKEPRRIVRVYAKENGLFGLQREYLER